MSRSTLHRAWQAAVPLGLRTRAHEWRQHRSRVRRIRFGDLGRTTPIQLDWGRSRGGPIDRLYIETFLERHRPDITGRVLEVADPGYTERLGVGVERIDVLDIDPANTQATIVDDVTDLETVPTGTFDCIIFTQVLQLVWDVQSAMRALERVLVPGGVLLATVPGILRNAPGKCDWWRFTSWSARRLAEETFAGGTVDVETFGNVLATTGFLYGLGRRDFDRATLEVSDPAFELLIGIRAKKASGEAS